MSLVFEIGELALLIVVHGRVWIIVDELKFLQLIIFLRLLVKIMLLIESQQASALAKRKCIRVVVVEVENDV
jgi:hypothetical protein